MNETLFTFIILTQVLRQKLEGDVAFELSILGFVDDTHAAFTKFLYDFIVEYFLPDHNIFTIYLVLSILLMNQHVGITCASPDRFNIEFPKMHQADFHLQKPKCAPEAGRVHALLGYV